MVPVERAAGAAIWLKAGHLPGSICRLNAKPLKTGRLQTEIHFCRKTFMKRVDSLIGLPL
jgi:hypothetical protein